MRALNFNPLMGKPEWGILAQRGKHPRVAKFIPHTGYSRFRPKRDFAMSNLDQFAELLSQGLTVRQAAARLGFKYTYGNAMLQRLRKNLGSQAV